MKRCRRQIWVLVAILFLASGLACHKEVEAPGTVLPVPDSRDDNGWPVYDIPKEGFALSLPPDWRQFDMSSGDFDSMIQQVLKENPELRPMLGGLRQQLTAGVKFFGFDPASAGKGFATNINVLHLPLPPGHNLDTLVAENVRQLRSLSTVVKPIARDRLVVAGQDRERLRYKMTMRGPDGRNNVLAFTQYLAADENSYYVLTLTTMPDREGTYASTFEQIGRSLRLIK